MPDSKIVLQSSPARSFVKGATWELRGFVTVLLVSWLAVGDPFTAMKITALYCPISLLMYFIHERIWKRISWGHREIIQRPHSGDMAAKKRSPLRWMGKP